jgi:inhibitor of growth protein 3
MANTEDCASVLEQFIHDAANLPAEISHMMEEIQAKDNELQKSLTSINNKDVNIQKHIKVNGVLQAHPKESEYADSVKKHFEMSTDLQNQKVLLSEKACALLDRQIKKLDIKIRELQNDNQLSLDGPPLPSIFNRKAEPGIFPSQPAIAALQNASASALNASAHRINSQVAASLQQAQPRPVAQAAALATAPQRSSAPATPAAVLQQRQREREASLGAESRKRKLGAITGATAPTQPSNLRQSSLGPGTPKAGTPTGTTGSRAGSVPRTVTVNPASAATANKKLMNPLSKKAALNQVTNKLKTKQIQRVSLGGRKKAQSPSVRSGRGGTAASEGDDSVLSSADASETDASQTRSRGSRKKKVKQEQDVERMEDGYDDEEVDDDTVYCMCQQPSYGEMVACENDDCKFQWFHTGCVNMKKIPEEDEDWYCPNCRVMPDIIEKVRIKAMGYKKAARK